MSASPSTWPALLRPWPLSTCFRAVHTLDTLPSSDHVLHMPGRRISRFCPATVAGLCLWIGPCRSVHDSCQFPSKLARILWTSSSARDAAGPHSSSPWHPSSPAFHHEAFKLFLKFAAMGSTKSVSSSVSSQEVVEPDDEAAKAFSEWGSLSGWSFSVKWMS